MVECRKKVEQITEERKEEVIKNLKSLGNTILGKHFSTEVLNSQENLD